MINFEPLTTDIVLDCDIEPRTRFKIRSLRFSDELAVKAARDAAGALPPSMLRHLSERWQQDGQAAKLDDEEQAALDSYVARATAEEIAVCKAGVLEIDCRAVTPEDVEQMLDAVPAAMRDKVRTELASKIRGLGAPSPKSETPSE